MAFRAYILRCADGKYDTGHTDDLDGHRASSRCDYGSRSLSIEPGWPESSGSRIEAPEAEQIVDGWSGGDKEALIADDWLMVSHLATPPKERNKRPVPEGFSTSLHTNGGKRAPGGGLQP